MARPATAGQDAPEDFHHMQAFQDAVDAEVARRLRLHELPPASSIGPGTAVPKSSKQAKMEPKVEMKVEPEDDSHDSYGLQPVIEHGLQPVKAEPGIEPKLRRFDWLNIPPKRRPNENLYLAKEAYEDAIKLLAGEHTPGIGVRGRTHPVPHYRHHLHAA